MSDNETGTVNRLAPNGRPPRASRVAGKEQEGVVIEPLRQAILTVPIVGTAPLKILRFSKKTQEQVRQTQEAGSQAKSKKKRDPKNFEQAYEEAKYLCTQKEGKKSVTWLGLNASGIRNGCIETCRMAGYAMTKAKMSIFAVEDGLDDLDSTPLVRIHGEPEMSVDPVRNASGVIDLRPRVMFKEWRMNIRIRFDESQFSPSDILNLLIRVGQQNGLGEGRPNGTNGNGTGNGLFLVNIDDCTLERLPVAPAVFKDDN